MNQTIDNKAYREHGLKWGLIMGLILGVFTNMFMFLTPDLMFNPIFSTSLTIVNLTAFILVLVWIGKKARSFTGYITLNQAFVALFFAVLTHVLITSAIGMITHTVNKERTETRMAEKKQEMIDQMEEQGKSDEEIENATEMMDKFSGQSSMMMILWLVIRLAIDIVIAYIIASSIKRNPPLEPIADTGSTGETT